MAKTNKTTSEEIIEKREASPVETACLIFSALALLGAISIVILELVDYRTDLGVYASSENPARTIAERDMGRFQDRVQKILAGTGGGGAAAGEGVGDLDLDTDLGTEETPEPEIDLDEENLFNEEP